MSVLPALALPKIRFDGRRLEKVSLSVWFHQTPVLSPILESFSLALAFFLQWPTQGGAGGLTFIHVT